MKITEYTPDRAKEVTELFYEAVYQIDPAIYSDQQKSAWAPLPINYEQWSARLAIKQPFILLINNKVAGFIELEESGYIDCAYVLPKYQKQGVATALVNYVLSACEHLNITSIHVDASIIAKPLFKKFGFVIQQKNEVKRNNVILINYTMVKFLN